MGKLCASLSELTRAGVIVACTIAISGSAYAQSAETIQLNDQAVAALQQGQYEEAEQILLQAIEGEPLNILYLNLGRTYAKWGKCDRAMLAYGDAVEAPTVTAPTRDEVLAVVDKYRAELESTCSPAPETAPQGQTAPSDDVPEQARDLSVYGPSETVTRVPVVPVTLVGVGAAGLVTAIVLDRTYVAPSLQALEDTRGRGRAEYDAQLEVVRDRRTVNRVLLAGSAVLAAAGATWWLIDGLGDRVALAPMGGPTELGAVCTFSF